MNTNCICQQMEFQGFGRRKIIVKNDGKMNTTDEGYLLLQQIEDLFCELFLDSLEKAPKSLILDFDATDIPIHENQANKFFHGY